MTQITRLKSAPETGSMIYIRQPREEDADEFIRLNRASIRLYSGLTSPMLTPQQYANYVRRCSQEDFAGFLICRKTDDAIVGSINLSQIFRGGFQSAYMGYQVGAPFARQGYMTEALELVLRYAFNRLKLHRLEANIQPHNVASIALVKRAGFIKEGFSKRYLKIGGRWRDHERWTMLAEDWRARKTGSGNKR
jgi:[ribosomal protein S5]-alanine N-acetyltransferase